MVSVKKSADPPKSRYLSDFQGFRIDVPIPGETDPGIKRGRGSKNTDKKKKDVVLEFQMRNASQENGISLEGGME